MYYLIVFNISFFPEFIFPDGMHSVQFSHSVVSNSLQPHGLQHARPPCPSPTPRVYSNSCPLTLWCHQTISSSVVPFCLQSFPASGSFLMSQLFTSSGQNTGASVSASGFNEYSGLISCRIDWFDLAVQRTLKSLLQHHSWKASVLWCSAFFMFSTHIHTWRLEKNSHNKLENSSRDGNTRPPDLPPDESVCRSRSNG